LIARRRAEALTPSEHEELLFLTNQAEQLEAERLARLAELARLRHTSLPILMEDLRLH
jgi:hypothetical protein